ncbi:MAG TPA: hypothetical protein VD927_06255 [Chryseosolibacter sp.]|nr:hypothetical protein [Chryseosolibacter sp.]
MKLTLLAFLVQFCFSAGAQKSEPKVIWGTEFKAPKRSSLDDIVGWDYTGIYALKARYGFNSAKYTLEHYDKKFNPTRSYDLELRQDGVEGKVELILQLRNKLYLFSSFPDSKTKKRILSVEEIDKKTLQPSGEKQKIAEIDYAGELRSNSGSYQVKVSRDSSKLLIVYNLPFKKNEPEAIGMTVLSDNLKPMWNKEIKLPFEDELFDLESYRVDNDGDVYLLGLIYNEKRKSKRRGAPNYKYQIFAYRDKGKTVKEYPVMLSDKFITDMQIEVLNNKNLICAGFYSAKGTYSIRGTYFLTIDAKTKDIKTKSFKEFGIDFITQNMTEGQAEKAKRKEEKGQENELYEYDLDRLIVGKDGSAILLGEQYYVTTQTHTSFVNGRTQSYTSTHFYYNDIIAVKVDPSGKIEWSEKIAKRQHTVDDGGFYSSYTMAIVKGQLCFIFNDDPRNVSYSGVGKVVNYRGGKESLVMLVTLDQKGKQRRQPLFSSADLEVITRPKVCEQITNNEVILFGQRRKTQQFASVTF